MSDTPDAAEEVTAVERWTYGGLRLDQKNRKIGAWITVDEKTAFFKHNAQHILGCVYEVTARRTPEGALLGMLGEPAYAGRSDDRDLITRLAAEDRAERQHLAIEQQKRKDKAENPLDQAIDALATVIRQIPHTQRPGLIGYVMYRLVRHL